MSMMALAWIITQAINTLGTCIENINSTDGTGWRVHVLKFCKYGKNGCSVYERANR